MRISAAVVMGLANLELSTVGMGIALVAGSAGPVEPVPPLAPGPAYVCADAQASTAHP